LTITEGFFYFGW